MVLVPCTTIDSRPEASRSIASVRLSPDAITFAMRESKPAWIREPSATPESILRPGPEGSRYRTTGPGVGRNPERGSSARTRASIAHRAGACGECRNSGYRGRLGVFELMEMDPVLRDLVFRGSSSLKIRDQARLSGGMVSLHDDCVRKVIEGVTSLDEVVRAARTADVFEGAA